MTCRLGEHHYLESGLDNVYLVDVELWECPCGENAVGIPAVPELQRVIGEVLLRKKTLLTGKEIRFLRKNIGIPSKKFAETLGVDQATVSRWENEKRLPDKPTDRLIRLVYAYEKGIPPKALLQDFPEISSELAPPLPMRIPRTWWTLGGDDKGACTR